MKQMSKCSSKQLQIMYSKASKQARQQQQNKETNKQTISNQNLQQTTSNFLFNRKIWPNLINILRYSDAAPRNKQNVKNKRKQTSTMNMNMYSSYAKCNKQRIYLYIIYVNELYYELCIVTMRLTKITIFATIRRTRKAGMI